MKLLPRTQFGNPILRTRAKKVNSGFASTKAGNALIRDMFYTMHKVGGVGLAAPQVGLSLRLAVIEIRKTKTRPHITPLPPTVIINPVIVHHSRKIVSGWEGCLSFDEVRGMVPRYKEITVSYHDEHGKKTVRVVKDFEARVFQHEIDHLNGAVYVDRMKDMKTLITLSEFKKRILGHNGQKIK